MPYITVPFNLEADDRYRHISSFIKTTDFPLNLLNNVSSGYKSTLIFGDQKCVSYELEVKKKLPLLETNRISVGKTTSVRRLKEFDM